MASSQLLAVQDHVKALIAAGPGPRTEPTMSNTIETEVCIIGAGPVGGTLACRLAADGVATAIIDRAPLPPMEHPDFDGRAYAIASGSRRVLEDAGLWERLPFPPGPIMDIRVSDGRLGRRASRLHLHFDSQDAGDEPFGWMVEARSLRMAINTRLAELPALSVFAPAQATVERNEEGARVHIAGGPTIAARLIVAAEGRTSPLREAAGIPVTHLPYNQTSIVCAIAHARPHNETALEHFLPSGPFAQLPMAGTDGAPHLSSIVWTERTAIAERMLALGDAAITQEIARRLGDHVGKIRLMGRRWRYPLSAMLVHRYYATRLALLGDAAHGIHPIAGQGLNLGFRDVGALAELVIEAASLGEDSGATALLRRYQARRRPDNMLMFAATDALDRLFSTNLFPVRLARDLGIAAVDRLPALKRLFMRQAMGAPTA
jgi:2-octaprenyl-6-methoxyphenol hydroxylase